MSMNRPEKPNIFKFGTSELTQDAFIAWLISWADPKFKNVDVALRKTGEELLSKIFELNGKKMPNIESLEVHAQKHNMDVYVKINDKFHIIVEDKIYSKTISEQLERYVKDLIEGQKIDRDRILPIFFKTRDQSKNIIEKNNFEIIERKNLINILAKGKNEGIKNDLYNQYYDYLLTIEKNVEAFRNRNPNNWKNPQWRGFFKYIYEKLGDGDWSYVSNKRGGFIGYWWNESTVKNHTVYLQIEKEKLCFKIRHENGLVVQKNDKRNWLRRVEEVSNEKSVPIIKPRKMGHGKHVTFAVWDLGDDDHWIPTMNDGIPNLKKAVKRLKIVENILNEAIHRV